MNKLVVLIIIIVGIWYFMKDNSNVPDCSSSEVQNALESSVYDIAKASVPGANSARMRGVLASLRVESGSIHTVSSDEDKRQSVCAARLGLSGVENNKRQGQSFDVRFLATYTESGAIEIAPAK